MSQPVPIPGGARRSSPTLSRPPSTSGRPRRLGYQATAGRAGRPSYGASGRDSGSDSEQGSLSDWNSKPRAVLSDRDDRRTTSLLPVPELFRAPSQPWTLPVRNVQIATSSTNAPHQRPGEEGRREKSNELTPTLVDTRPSPAAAPSARSSRRRSASVRPPSPMVHSLELSASSRHSSAAATSGLPANSTAPLPSTTPTQARASSLDMPMFSLSGGLGSRRGSNSSADSARARAYGQHVRSEDARAALLQRDTAKIVDARRRRAEWMSDLEQESAARERSRRPLRSRSSSVPESPTAADASGRRTLPTHRHRGSDASAGSFSGRRVPLEGSLPVDGPALRHRRSYSTTASPDRVSRPALQDYFGGAANAPSTTRYRQASYANSPSTGHHSSIPHRGTRRFSDSIAPDNRPSQAVLRRQASSSSARSGREMGASEGAHILARAAELVQQERRAHEHIEAEQRRILVEQWRAQQEEHLRTKDDDPQVPDRRSSVYEPVSSQSRPPRSSSTSTPERPRATPTTSRRTASVSVSAELDNDEPEWVRVLRQEHVIRLKAQKKLVEDEFQYKWPDIANQEAEVALKPPSNTEDYQAERAQQKREAEERQKLRREAEERQERQKRAEQEREGQRREKLDRARREEPERVRREEQERVRREAEKRDADRRAVDERARRQREAGDREREHLKCEAEQLLREEEFARREEEARRRYQDRRPQEDEEKERRRYASSSNTSTFPGSPPPFSSSTPGTPSSFTNASTAAAASSSGGMERAWAAYEKAWTGLPDKAAKAPLRWNDIPWPMIVPPRRAEGLVNGSIANFILSPTHSQGKSPKERLRDALLRWHPDRFEGRWLPKCAEGELEEIKLGAMLVVNTLTALVSELNRNTPRPQPTAAENQKTTMGVNRAATPDGNSDDGVSCGWTLPRDDYLGQGSKVVMKNFISDKWVPITVSSVAPIASGNSAYIYRGTIEGMEARIVALKVFPFIMRDTERELLSRELINVSHIARGPGCEHILPFIGAAMHDGRMILVSEFMSNGNMLDFLTQSPAASRRQLVVQVAEGITFLHTTPRLVHGDLKCENVLVNSSGSAVIADFGLSTTIDKFDHTTAAGIRHWNTLAFAAPELHLDEATDSPEEHRLRSKTPKSDVYAFGMLVLQAFTGKRPWPGSTGQAILRKVCNGEKPERPGDEITALGLTDAWWGVCMKCWETSPRDRPSIDTVLAELRATTLIDARIET